MKYILDFDHTLFDSDRFKETMRQDGRGALVMTPQAWDYYNARDFFYEDTIAFLEDHSKEELIILTAMASVPTPAACEYQREKLRNAGMEEWVQSVIIMEGDKGPYVAQLYEANTTVFIDDRVQNVESAKKQCSDVYCMQIIREGVTKEIVPTTHPNIPIIRKLADVDAIIEQ